MRGREERSPSLRGTQAEKQKQQKTHHKQVYHPHIIQTTSHQGDARDGKAPLGLVGRQKKILKIRLGILKIRPFMWGPSARGADAVKTIHDGGVYV